MKQLSTLIIASVITLMTISCNQSADNEDDRVHFQNDAKEIVSKMSLEEKIGQLFMIGFYGPEVDYYLNKMINKRNIGGVILMKYNLESEQQTKGLIEDIQYRADTAYPPIPLFISVDQEGGIVSRVQFEGINELTAQKDIQTNEQAFKVALRRGNELRNLGIHINYSPVVENISDTSSFLYQRVFHVNDGAEVASLGASMIEGYTEAGIAAVPKHFPGHTNNSLDSHGQLPIENIESIDHLVNTYDSILKSNPKIIMTSHVMYPQIDSLYPATLSKEILDYLKVDLNYDGLIISDDMEMKAIENNYTLEKASVLALNAGVDILMFCSTPQKQADAYNAIVAAVKSREIDESLINEKVVKIMSLKQELMLNEVK